MPDPTPSAPARDLSDARNSTIQLCAIQPFPSSANVTKLQSKIVSAKKMGRKNPPTSETTPPALDRLGSRQLAVRSLCFAVATRVSGSSGNRGLYSAVQLQARLQAVKTR